ncbi:hypothetical protein J7I98_04470 [Streptomyces sp. ISL-98]|uniref:hypothetical protein n=1 Tax=Streptomyces sp. ISL-98 TaxID=2819192 RepID=UPI001BEC1D00|nr:hypothetical protein [Streptomyces sp. ISL-98]MBT2505163.1 hypothetical protein [Streptomyces sp. ISL-98]
MTAWLAGMRITAGRLLTHTSTITTAGLAAAAGFSVNDFRGARSGNTVVLDMYVQRTGAAIALVGGQLPDTDICTAPSGWRPAAGPVNGDWDDGICTGGFVIATSGLCTLRTSTADIATSRNLRLHISFIVE